MVANRLAVALCFVAVSCVASAPLSQSRWTTAKIIGLHLELIDSTRVEQYSFTKNYVVPSVSSHDIVIDPLWHWKIRDGRLQIYGESRLEDELTLLSIDPKTIIVRKRSGEVARYRYSYHR
jgi:hypothetical protein